MGSSPDSDRAMTNSTVASVVTNAVDWSWKPQPICSPPARSATSTPATAANDASTPAA